MDDERFEEWAVVALFGHKEIAGLVSSQVIGGETFLRVDVPDEGDDEWLFTQLYGKGAVYSITFCTEEAARIAARRLDVRPVTLWTVPNVTRALSEPEIEETEWEYRSRMALEG